MDENLNNMDIEQRLHEEISKLKKAVQIIDESKDAILEAAKIKDDFINKYNELQTSFSDYKSQIAKILDNISVQSSKSETFDIESFVAKNHEIEIKIISLKDSFEHYKKEGDSNYKKTLDSLNILSNGLQSISTCPQDITHLKSDQKNINDKLVTLSSNFSSFKSKQSKINKRTTILIILSFILLLSFFSYLYLVYI